MERGRKSEAQTSTAVREAHRGTFSTRGDLQKRVTDSSSPPSQGYDDDGDEEEMVGGS